MPTTTNAVVAALFAELVDGTTSLGGPFILNTGDDGLLRSLDNLGPDEASRSVSGGATIAAHAQHVRFGLSLMNQWAAQGDNPFADPKWDEAWTTGEVDAIRWHEIRTGLQRTWHITSARFDRLPARPADHEEGRLSAKANRVLFQSSRTARDQLSNLAVPV